MISDEILSKIENYNEYLLSKNICLIIQQKYGAEKINTKSLILLTKVLSNFITDLSHNIKKCTELAGREESNIIDLLFTLSFKNKTQQSLLSYIKADSIQSNTNKKFDELYNMKSILANEEKQRMKILEELNCIHVPNSNCINKSVLASIPKSLRYFPREFTLKNSENIIENNEKGIKEKNEIKKLEKKNLEEIISGNNYYEINQRNNVNKGDDFKCVDLVSSYDEIIKELNNNNELFGQKFNLRKFQDEHKENETDNKGIIIGLGDTHLNGNIEIELGHDYENE